jgi:hypothetical protein
VQPPAAYFTSTLGLMTTPNAGNCSIGEPDAPFWTVGSSADNPVGNGSTWEGATYSVTCQVTASNGAYNIQLSLSEGEQYSINISGTLSDSPGTVQSGINAEFANNVVQYGSTAENMCTITLTTMAPNNTPITAGRVWGTLNCPTLSDPEVNDVCTATATFLFENCQE